MFTECASAVREQLAGLSESQIVERLRQSVLPSDAVVLSGERRPFAALSDEAILGYFRFFERFPEAMGRLSLALKRAFSIEAPCPTHFTVKESHFDLNTLDPDLLDKLVPLGFEPDHFVTLNPPEYTWCLTMKMEVPFGPAHGARVRKIHDMMFANSVAAKDITEAYEFVFGYLEMETYSSKTRHVLPFREVSDEGLEAFPFLKGGFEPIFPPSTEQEALLSGLPLDVHKRIDIHVKIPTEVRGAEFRGADSSRMKQLREKFLCAGFYEIYSEAGNQVYTVQLLGAKHSKTVFFMLKEWADRYGGVIGLKMETCNYFYRTPRKLEQGRLAPIPNLVIWRGGGEHDRV
jgi:hypothetical protein